MSSSGMNLLLDVVAAWQFLCSSNSICWVQLCSSLGRCRTLPSEYEAKFTMWCFPWHMKKKIELLEHTFCNCWRPWKHSPILKILYFCLHYCEVWDNFFPFSIDSNGPSLSHIYKSMEFSLVVTLLKVLTLLILLQAWLFLIYSIGVG